LSPSSGLKNELSKKQRSKQLASRTRTLVSYLAYSSNMKMEMETICSSETSVVVRRVTWRYIPEDRILHKHRCENLKS
jgi:hypothetical protein